MKTRIFPYALMVATIAISAVFIFQSCQKSVGPFDPSTATYQYNLKGQVVDAHTNAGIPSATVKILNKVYTADINGNFTFRVSYATTFPFEISAEAPNYIIGSSLISGPTQVRAIRLTMQNPEVILNENGGTLVAQSTEGISGASFSVTFPAASLAQSTSLSLTPMEEFYYMYENVKNLPKSTNDLLDLATISVAPEGLTYLKPVTLYCPLPFANDMGTRFPVLRYDAATNVWTYTGKDLVVDATKTGGSVELTQGGIYSVAGKGVYTESKESQTLLFNYACQGEAPYVWQASIDHPAGTPNGVSAIWLKNIVSHNTIIGGHVSFLRETSTNIVCESYQPGSSHPVPSDEVDLPLIPQCPSGTNPVLLDNGVSMNNRVISGNLSFISYNNGAPETNIVPDLAIVNVAIHAYTWRCIHDQGGGK